MADRLRAVFGLAIIRFLPLEISAISKITYRDPFLRPFYLYYHIHSVIRNAGRMALWVDVYVNDFLG